MQRMIIVMTGVLVLSGLVLAASYSGLSPRIEENRVAALNASLASIFTPSDGASPEAAGLTFSQLDTDRSVVYSGERDGRLVGYAVRLQAQGYGGAITLLVGLSPYLESVSGLQVVEQVETPGLGGRITEAAFRRQFERLRADRPISFVKNIEPDPGANEIQAISGATITSRAVVVGINEQLASALDAIARSR